MKYSKIITLKNGMECCLRNATESDGQLVLDNFNLTLPKPTICLHIPMKTLLMQHKKAGF